MSQEIYEGLSESDLKNSLSGTELLKGKVVEGFRYRTRSGSTAGNELLIVFSDGTRLFVDDLKDEYSISITGGSGE